jgi:hypothetical protein
VILDRNLLPLFVAWLKDILGFPVKSTTEDVWRRTGQIYRFMRGENLHVIREHTASVLDAPTVEVWTSNKDSLADLERGFVSHLQSLIAPQPVENHDDSSKPDN